MTPAEAVAAVAPIADRILPPNAAPIERAVLMAELARIAAVDPTVIVSIWNPATCPAVLLPWLAQGVSVDVWSNDWPEAQKRAVVAASPMVHRLKGTIGAVRRALAAFDLETRVVEWWEDGSRRGTFRIEIIYRNGGPVFDLPTQGYAIQAVDAAKPKSRVFTTLATVRARGPIYVGALAQTAISATAHPFVFDPPVLRATNYVGATAATIISATAHVRAA
ncbi:MAG: phage tail protein I [Xanthobacteraceae bacterium]